MNNKKLTDPPQPSTRGPGRPRSPISHQAIIDATFTLLEQHGFLRLTIEAIAKQAHVSKATIYRRWPNKSALILDLLMDTVGEIDARCKHDSPREELRRRLLALVEVANSTYGRNFTEIVAASHGDEELGTLFISRFLQPRRLRLRQLVDRAIQLGEIAPPVDPELMIDMLYGPIFYRMMVSRGAVTVEFVEQLIKQILGPQVASV